MTPSWDNEAERVRAALAAIPAEDYETWVDMAFALKQGFGDDGFVIWDTWSRTAANYDERAARSTWRSASASGGKTLASLFWRAREHGFSLWRTWATDYSTSLSVPSQQVVEQRELDESRREARHAKAAREAIALWQWAHPVGPAHPYLVRKGVEPVTTLRELDSQKLRALLGYAPANKAEKLTGRVLLVPVWSGPISTLELIDEQGLKCSLAGGAKKGGYWMTAPLPLCGDASLPILIGEGMATALAASRATGWVAVAALSSWNLSRVATHLRACHPDTDLIVLGELGHGADQASHAAEEARARVAWPQFAANARIDGKRPTDFNDMVVLSGFDVAGERLREATRFVSKASRVHLNRMDKSAEGRAMSDGKEGVFPEDASASPRQSSKRKPRQHTGTKSSSISSLSVADGPVSVSGTWPPDTVSPAEVAQPSSEHLGSPKNPSARLLVGEPLFLVGDVPNEIKTLTEHRFGSPLRMGTPRENGGPYRGEVFNTEHYLIQEVAPRSVVFHRKDLINFVAERLKWMDENGRLNGAEIQIVYDASVAKLYPWDRAREQLERTVGSLKKSAQELNFSAELGATLDQLQARSWARIRELRNQVREKSKGGVDSPATDQEINKESPHGSMESKSRG